LVWEEAARSGIDATAGFRELAVKAGFQERSVQTLEEATLARRADREAKDYLKGAALTPEHAEDLIKRLKKADRFGWARRVIAKIRKTSVGNSALGIWFVQQHALCTYKDPDLPVLKALDQALAILRESFDLENTSDQETLGIAGAIHKRRWQATGQKGQLERSFLYYRRGHNIGLEKDYGYTGINAAFALDQLADIEMTDGAPSVESRRAEAREIREALVARLVPLRAAAPKLAANWWYLVTVAEALFGLGRYDEAERWLLDAKAVLNVPDWEFRSTASQLATLYQLQHRGTAGAQAADRTPGDRNLQPPVLR
jgi:tetratricopeptide (TPR) repeat protein